MGNCKKCHRLKSLLYKYKKRESMPKEDLNKASQAIEILNIEKETAL